MKPPASHPVSEQTSLNLLGWNLIQHHLARQAESPVTQSRCSTLTPATDLETARRLLDETAEMVALIESAEHFPMRTFHDLSPILQQAEERHLIEPSAFLALLNILNLVRDIKRFLQKQDRVPRLRAYRENLEPLSELSREITRCIHPDGDVHENASPELKQAHQEMRKIRTRLETTVRKIMGSAAFKEALQDTYTTEREGRVVFPVKSEARSKIDGIIHDSSSSGQTLFVEPPQILPLNNQLKIARMDVEREKIKVLQKLTGEVLLHRESLTTNLDQLAALDLILAKARLAGTMQAQPCLLQQEGPVSLYQARNPELVLNGQSVVANDIVWDAPVKVVIISGPNTGGKTVTLKTVGLMSLMARAGLFLPVAPHSTIRFFPMVYADIGDDQNIELQLSTFSAHLQKIIHILSQAPKGALILLDELGIATDPQEGAALAEAILLEMQQRGFMTLVSTHYLALKTMAQTQAGFLNACMGFDLDSLAPTYKLVFGVPGHSAALDTAERLGLHPETLSRAREIYQQVDNRSEILLKDLNQQKLILEKKLEEMADTLAETKKNLEEQKAIKKILASEQQDFLKNKTQRLQAYVREGKREIRKMIEDLRGKPDANKLKTAEKQLHHMGRLPTVSDPHLRSIWNLPVAQLRQGAPILVEPYEAVGKLMDDPKGKTKVRVQLGNIFMVVDAKHVFGNSQAPPEAKNLTPKNNVSIQTESQSSPQATCDLRGMRMDEAKETVELFLSRAVMNKLPKATIIHGHGMGKLKQLVRDLLASSGIGKKHVPGERHEGGDGVTVVHF